MSKHTPGPWFIDERGTHDIEVGTYFKANPTMFNAIAEDVDGMANARLIASAPDLLKALISIVSKYEGPCAMTRPFEMDAMARIAKDAIAKAEAKE